MRGKYQAYPEYKSAGIEWLDNIPNHWSVPSLKMLIDVRDGTHETPSYVVKTENSFPLVTSKDVTSGQLSFEQCKHISKDDYRSIIQRSKVDAGDILMPMIGTVGSPIVVKGRGDFAIKNLALFKTSNNQNIDTEFLNYFLQSNECDTQFSLEARGGVQNFVSLGTLRDLGFPKAPNDEQVQIANFLDHETAKIDALIEKQQQLIKLLKEKRQAAISHAVTKGLNPNVPMCDSDVEWLDEVPEHWEVATVRRYLLEHRQGYYTTEAYVDDGIKLLRITDLRDLGEISTSNCPKVADSDTLSNYLLQEGDVVFARTGGAGSFGVIPKLTETVAYASYLIRFRFLPKHFSRDYLRFMLVADSFQLAVKRNIHGGVNQNIHAEDIKDTFVASPPLEEQREISLYLDVQSSKYAELIDKGESAIELMQERRTAIISAAVTGKIDVRNWQEPKPTNTANDKEVPA